MKLSIKTFESLMSEESKKAGGEKKVRKEKEKVDQIDIELQISQAYEKKRAELKELELYI